MPFLKGKLISGLIPKIKHPTAKSCLVLFSDSSIYIRYARAQPHSSHLSFTNTASCTASCTAVHLHCTAVAPIAPQVAPAPPRPPPGPTCSCVVLVAWRRPWSRALVLKTHQPQRAGRLAARALHGRAPPGTCRINPVRLVRYTCVECATVVLVVLLSCFFAFLESLFQLPFALAF